MANAPINLAPLPAATTGLPSVFQQFVDAAGQFYPMQQQQLMQKYQLEAQKAQLLDAQLGRLRTLAENNPALANDSNMIGEVKSVYKGFGLTPPITVDPNTGQPMVDMKALNGNVFQQWMDSNPANQKMWNESSVEARKSFAAYHPTWFIPPEAINAPIQPTDMAQLHLSDALARTQELAAEKGFDLDATKQILMAYAPEYDKFYGAGALENQLLPSLKQTLTKQLLDQLKKSGLTEKEMQARTNLITQQIVNAKSTDELIAARTRLVNIEAQDKPELDAARIQQMKASATHLYASAAHLQQLGDPKMILSMARVAETHEKDLQAEHDKQLGIINQGLTWLGQNPNGDQATKDFWNDQVAKAKQNLKDINQPLYEAKRVRSKAYDRLNAIHADTSGAESVSDLEGLRAAYSQAKGRGAKYFSQWRAWAKSRFHLDDNTLDSLGY